MGVGAGVVGPWHWEEVCDPQTTSHFILDCPFYHCLRGSWKVPNWFLLASTASRCKWLGRHLQLMVDFVKLTSRFQWEWECPLPKPEDDKQKKQKKQKQKLKQT